uniref:Uncharacterized protein n=1 Tax=Sphaerodactylus townsendi TaxID=933632 RepID=A0ACB8EIY4_9SAUR
MFVSQKGCPSQLLCPRRDAGEVFWVLGQVGEGECLRHLDLRKGKKTKTAALRILTWEQDPLNKLQLLNKHVQNCTVGVFHEKLPSLRPCYWVRREQTDRERDTHTHTHTHTQRAVWKVC